MLIRKIWVCHVFRDVFPFLCCSITVSVFFIIIICSTLPGSVSDSILAATIYTCFYTYPKKKAHEQHVFLCCLNQQPDMPGSKR